MNDEDILLWVQSFGCGFRHGQNSGEFYFDWLDKNGCIITTKGCNLRDAVIGAKLHRDKLYS